MSYPYGEASYAQRLVEKCGLRLRTCVFDRGATKFEVPQLDFEVPQLDFEVPQHDFEVPQHDFEVPQHDFEVLQHDFEVSVFSNARHQLRQIIKITPPDSTASKTCQSAIARW